MFETIKAANEAGFRERKKWEYGGEEITVKGRLLVRNPREAISKSAWSKQGFCVPRDAEPHSDRFAYFEGGGNRHYPVYREDQVAPKRQVSPTPPVQIDVLAAVWVINRRAKRCRDLAQAYYRRRAHGFAGAAKDEKLQLYRLQGQALHYLLAEGRLAVAGHHRFPGGHWAEVLRGEGYTFHRPCPEMSDATVVELDGIEAKPRGNKEPRLKDARHTVASRPWPSRPRRCGRTPPRPGNAAAPPPGGP
jgi:hypothetical protein